MKNMPSVKTQHEMVRFLMKTVIPRMIEKQRKEEKALPKELRNNLKCARKNKF